MQIKRQKQLRGRVMKKNWVIIIGVLVFIGIVGFLVLNTFNLTKVAQTNSRIVDNINLPFVNDPEIIGTWQSVDFVKEISDFNPENIKRQGDLYLKGMTFLKKGKTPQGWWGWTKGVIMHYGDKTAAKYEIKQIKGSKYLFLEWKSGDYTIRHMKPQFYVLRKSSV
jgi:bla regulator protein blaR1